MDNAELHIKKFWQPDETYICHRIPGIFVTSRSTVIVYNEARRTFSDWALMDIFLQRSEDGGETFTEVSNTATVSMNMWGFPLAYLRALEVKFPEFLKKTVIDNPLKGEFFLPIVVDELLQAKEATVKVMRSSDKWFGVTYKEDKPAVEAGIRALKDAGKYPENLWEA